MTPRSIVLASSNPAKRLQLRWLLAGLPLHPVDPAPTVITEDAGSLAGNAALKAVAHSAAGLAIASDGGLEVPALAGRWEPLSTHRQGQSGLLRLTSGLADRRVLWSEAVAVAGKGRLLNAWTETGTAGVLIPEPWPPPTDFWVWDLFAFPELGKVWSQLTPRERARVDRTWLRLRRRVRAFFRGLFEPPHSRT